MKKWLVARGWWLVGRLEWGTLEQFTTETRRTQRRPNSVLWFFRRQRLTSRFVLMLILVSSTGALAGPPEMPRFKWENFTTANGLPDNHVFNVLVDGNRVWAATENGVGLYENGKWKAFTPADGLAHRAVLYLALDKRTGDVWAATMGGLSRISAGRIVTFNQLNSGVANDVVYGVAVQGD